MPVASLRHYRPDLHRDPSSVHAGPGLGDLYRLIDGVGLQQRVTAKDLLGLHERAVGHPACPHGLGLVRPVELVAGIGELSGAAMSPQVTLDEDERTSTMTIGANLKFLSAEVGRQARAGQGTLLRAYGLLSASPRGGSPLPA